MNSSVYVSPSNGHTNGYTLLHRPATISELAARAHENLWDPSKGLKHWLRIADKARKNAETYEASGDYENAFIQYAKAATLVLEKLPTHRDYNVLLSRDQQNNLGMNGQDILDSLSQIKPILVERYELWLEQQNPSSSRPASSPQPYEDVARDERLQARHDQQEERARHALEAARREQDWQRDDLARRQAEERERQARAEGAYTREMEQRRRAQAAERRMAAERERAELDRREEEARREDERRRLEEKRRQDAETAALTSRMEIATRLSPSPMAVPQYGSAEVGTTRSVPRGFPIAAPQPAQAGNSSQHSSLYGSSNGLSIMPLESPTRNDDDSSTDAEGADRQTWSRRKQPEQTPTKKSYTPGISYPPPITTTSPPPPELGSVRYPNLMSQHQLKQGYVPSLQSMFSKPANEPRAPDASLLFDKAAMFPSSLPNPSTPPVVPPFPAHLTDARSRGSSASYPRLGHRGPSPGSGRDTPSSSARSAPRIVASTSNDSVRELKTIKMPRECLQRFLSIARVNTLQNRETCGLLLGKDRGNKYIVTTLLVPKQHSTSDTCTMDEEELVLQFTEERHLITLGWIHTHPTQSCFMSSVDLHTHSGFQRMLPESFAVVCAPASTPTFGIFRLTDPGGLQTILDCTAKEAFHPHPEVPIYTDCDNCHVQMKDMGIEIVDLR